MNKEQAKAEAKKHLVQYVEKFCKRDKKAGPRHYACPFCDSGHGGKNSDGAFSIKGNGEYWKCFSCGRSGDIFDLVRLKENIDGADLFQRVYDMCGITVDENDQSTEPQAKAPNSAAASGTDPLQEEPEEDLIDYFKSCAQKRDQIRPYLESRGISEVVANHYMLGADPLYCRGTGGKIWNAPPLPALSRHAYRA